MSELLLELFSEEIPARMQARAAADLEKAVNDRLIKAGFMPEGVKGFATPRRLAVVATGLPVRQPDRREEKKGPRVGAPDKAVEGFLKSAGLASLDQCEQREDKKGAYYVAVIDEKGGATAELIASFVPEIVRGFSWPKSMRWADGDLKWVRPLHRVLCAFDGEVVNFDIDGIKSSDKTEGHRFMAPDEIQARSYDDYAGKLRNAKVILEMDERKEIIASDAATLCKAQGLELVEDQGLLNEVAGLAEWPVAMMGEYDEKFLALPDEVLTASMRGHQKYFSVKDPKTDRLANKFICVANIEAPDGGKAMREGYERVLTARLSDGWYLYNQDLKRPLADRIDDLDRVTFFEGLGSVGDKARRIAALAKEIAPSVGADPEAAARAAMLAKADLVTGMVYEFPELQGVMGRYYHLAQSGFSSPIHGGGGREAAGGGDGAKTPSVASGDSSPAGGGAEEAQAIADAIRDHYKPAGQDDEVPTAPVSVAVALADKIDTLTAFWAIDQKPTGSKDPFALRRAALGVIELILNSNCRVPLVSVFLYHTSERLFGLESANIELRNRLRSEVAMVADIAEAKVKPTTFAAILNRLDRSLLTDELPKINDIRLASENLNAFFHDRLKVYLRDKGHRHDHIDAVLIDADGNLQDDLVLIVAKLEALEAFLRTDDGENLAAAYKRAANILKAEEKKDKASVSAPVDPALLTAEEEKKLYAALLNAEGQAEKAVAEEDFKTAMAALASLRAPLDAFFDKVTVNDDDKAVRANRLALLARLRAGTAKVADFSRLEG